MQLKTLTLRVCVVATTLVAFPFDGFANAIVCNHRTEFEQDTMEKKIGCNSISATTGVVTADALYTDANAVGIEGSIEISRGYHSMRAAFEILRDVDTAQPIAFDSWDSGWSHDFERFTFADLTSGSLYYVRPEGENTQEFIPNADPGCTAFDLELNSYFGGEYYGAVQMAVVGSCTATTLGELELWVQETDGSVWKFGWAYGAVWFLYEVVEPDGYTLDFHYFDPGAAVTDCQSPATYEAGRLCQIRGSDDATVKFSYYDPTTTGFIGRDGIAAIEAGPAPSVMATKAVYSYEEKTRVVEDCALETVSLCESMSAWSARSSSDPATTLWVLSGVDHQRQGTSGWETHSSETYEYTKTSYYNPEADVSYGYGTKQTIRRPFVEDYDHERVEMWLLRRVLRGTASGDAFVAGHEYTSCGLGATDEKSGAYEWVGYVPDSTPAFECGFTGDATVVYTDASSGELREYRINIDGAELLEISDDCGCSSSATNFERSSLQVNAKSDASGVRTAFTYDSLRRPILEQMNWDGNETVQATSPFPGPMENSGKPVRLTRWEYADSASAEHTVESSVFSAPCETQESAFSSYSCTGYPGTPATEPMREVDYDPDHTGGYNDTASEARPSREKMAGWTATSASSTTLTRQERETKYEYSGTYLTAVVDPKGTRTEYRYHLSGADAGRLHEVVWDDGVTEITLQTYSHYDTEGRPGRVEDENGAYRVLEYDLDGRLSKTTHYNASSTAVRETVLSYRDDEQLESVSVGPVGGPYVTRQSASATPVGVDAPSATSFCNQQAQTSLSAFQTRLSACLSALAYVEKTTEHSSGILDGSFTAQEATALEYSTSGDASRSETLDAASSLFALQTMEHDAAGRLQRSWRYTSSSTTASGVRDYGYDSRGLLTQVTDPRYGSTAASNATNLASANRTMTYNAFREVASTTVGAGTVDAGTTNYDYDAHGNLARVTDADGRVTSYLYDDFGALLAVESPDSGTTTYAYNSMGQVVGKQFEDGQLVTYSYDTRHRLSSEVYGGTSPLTISYHYDTLPVSPTSASCPSGTVDFDPDATTMGGRLAAVTHEAGRTFYSYDSLGQTIATYEQPGSTFSICDLEIVRYAYDEAGRVTSLTYPSGLVVDYEFEDVSSVPTLYASELVVDGTPFLEDVVYAPGGQMAGYASGAIDFSATWNYAGEANTRLYEDASSGADLFDWDVTTRDENGNITLAREHVLNQRQDFEYDFQDRLISSDSLTTGTETVARGKQKCDWTYDATGNRTSEQCFGKTTVTYNYDTGSNRLASLSWAADADICGPSPADVVRLISRDSRGRAMSTYGDGFPASADVYQLSYGVFGRLSSVDVDGDSNPDHEYTYDHRGRRVSKTDLGTSVTTRFEYSHIGQLLAESEGVSRQYIWVANQIVGVARTTAPTRSLVVSDHLGTPRSAYSTAGSLVWAVDREAFGRTRASVETINIPIRFPGQIEDSETNLHYNVARYFHPSFGRYAAPDPLGQFGGDPTAFVYAGSNPQVSTDPEGLFQAPPPAVGVGTAGAAGAVTGAAAGGVLIGLGVNYFFGDEIQKALDNAFGDGIKPGVQGPPAGASGKCEEASRGNRRREGERRRTGSGDRNPNPDKKKRWNQKEKRWERKDPQTGKWKRTTPPKT